MDIVITFCLVQTRPQRRPLLPSTPPVSFTFDCQTSLTRLPSTYCRLKATPEYRQWAVRRRRDRVMKAITSASTLRAVTMLVIAGAAFWAGQITPPGALPELLQPSMAPAEPQLPPPQPNSDLLLQLETERNLAQSYGSRVEKLSAKVASLQSEHSTELQDRLARHQEEVSRRDKELKDLKAKIVSDSRAERARLEQAEKANAKALAESHAQQAQLRSELERSLKKLTSAQEVTYPSVHPCNLCCLPVKSCLRQTLLHGGFQTISAILRLRDRQSDTHLMSSLKVCMSGDHENVSMPMLLL